MSYTKTIWLDNGGSPISAANLNKIEAGIKLGADHSETLHSPSNADNTALNETSHFDVLVDSDVGTVVQGYNIYTVIDNAYVHTDNNYTTVDKALVQGALQSETNTTLSLTTNILTYTDELGAETNIDLNLYLDDTNLARVVSGTYDSGTNSLVFTRDDSSTFSIDASMFFDDTNLVTSVNGSTGAVTISNITGNSGTVTNGVYTTDVLTPISTLNKIVTESDISGFGDMLKTVYDSTDNGIVDNSEKVNGLTVETAVPVNALFTDTINTVDSIDDLSDVDTTTIVPSDNDVLHWNGTNWAPKFFPDYQTVLDAELKQYLTTGFISGLELIINTLDNTKFDILPGMYVITDYTNPLLPVPAPFVFAGISGVSPNYLLTSSATYVALDVNGDIFQSSSPFTSTDRRNYCLVGAAIHPGHVILDYVNEIKAPIVGDTNQLHDLMRVIGTINVDGNVYAPNGANLSLNKSAGIIFGLGINAHDVNNPHELTLPSETIVQIQYRIRTGTIYADTTSVNPNSWDNNGVLSVVDNNKFTVQHINLFQSGATRIQYGQTQYANIEDAKAFASTDPYITEQNIAQNAVFRCYLIMQKGITDLLSAVSLNLAHFIIVNKFGSVVGGAASALTYESLIATLGYNPADIANKQNSLITDGTGIKYPTVDAVNAGLNLKLSKTSSEDLIFTNTLNGVILTSPNASKYRITVSDGGTLITTLVV